MSDKNYAINESEDHSKRPTRLQRFKGWCKRTIPKIVGVCALGATVYYIFHESGDKALTSKKEISDDNLSIDDQPISVPSNILENLCGNRLNAKKLGERTGVSAQAINKRIVAAGLAEKLGDDQYYLTEKGKPLGEKSYKDTPWGYSYANIEWDEMVLLLIYSPEELDELEQSYPKIKELRSRLDSAA